VRSIPPDDLAPVPCPGCGHPPNIKQQSSGRAGIMRWHVRCPSHPDDCAVRFKAYSTNRGTSIRSWNDAAALWTRARTESPHPATGEAEIQPGPRCRCGLSLPCNACLPSISDLATGRRGESNCHYHRACDGA
jgi:hypothetical protein